MSLKSDIPFGAWVEVSSRIIRHKDRNKRTWIKMIVNPPMKCLFLGARLFADGDMSYINNGEDGTDYYFTADKYHRGALVCPKSGKPFKTLLEDCKLVPDPLHGIPEGLDACYTSGTYLGIPREFKCSCGPGPEHSDSCKAWPEKW